MSQEEIKNMMHVQLNNIEAGFSEAIGNGAFKNLKYAANLQQSIDIIRAYFESMPTEKMPTELQKTSSNGKA